jgi:hypothetical protein
MSNELPASREPARSASHACIDTPYIGAAGSAHHPLEILDLAEVHMFRLPPLSALLPLVMIACVSPGHTVRPVPDREFITQDEIGQAQGMNAYEVIHSLRANFLNSRGPTSLIGTSSPYPTVYVDGQRYGSIEMLREIPAMQISSIRLYRSWEAMTRFGNGNMGGVIAITTRLDSR